MDYKFIKHQYKIILESKETSAIPYPLLKNNLGNEIAFNISPIHGRSFVVGQNRNGKFIVCKGGGLSFTNHAFLNTREFGDDTLGLLLKNDAIRDFTIGNEINALGIKTNTMEYVLEITDNPITIPVTGDTVNPFILQHTVECPYRIEDAIFMKKDCIMKEVKKWEHMNNKGYSQNYMIAADILINNLRILHDNSILHNALTIHNYSWALELLDFEIAHSPKYPYTKEDDQRHVKDLFAREIIDVYKIINYIAAVLNESIDYLKVDRLFKDYGFDLEKYKL